MCVCVCVLYTEVGEKRGKKGKKGGKKHLAQSSMYNTYVSVCVCVCVSECVFFVSMCIYIYHVYEYVCSVQAPKLN